MDALADIVEEQVERRKWNRHLLDDNARMCRALPPRSSDPLKTSVVVNKTETRSTVNQTAVEPQQIPQQMEVRRTAESQVEISQPEKTPFQKWGPYVLASVLGASVVGVPWALSDKGGDPVSNGTKDDSSSDVLDIDAQSNTYNSERSKKSIFTVIQDEMKHLED